MTRFVFTGKVKETFSKLEQHEQNRIVEKLQFLKNHLDILSVIKRIKYMEPATHRLRIGQNRLLLQLIKNDDKNHVFHATKSRSEPKGEQIERSENLFRILKIGHRREVYR